MKQMLIVLVLLMLGIGTIQAQEEAQGGEVPDFSAMDSNQDGLISREESAASPDVESNFTAADADRNGYLNQDEFDELINSILQ